MELHDRYAAEVAERQGNHHRQHVWLAEVAQRTPVVGPAFRGAGAPLPTRRQSATSIDHRGGATHCDTK